MASLEGDEMTFQHQEANQVDQPSDLTSFQFVPDKIVDFSIAQDGQRSYRVRWKDSWLTEELLALTYQHLIDDFWSTAAANASKTEKAKVRASKTSNIKIINKQNQFENHYQIENQTTSPSVQIQVNRGDVHVSLKDITSSDSSQNPHLLDDVNTINKNQNDLNKMQNASLSSIVVNSDVSLAASSLQYPDMPPTMIQNPPIPKYQQALQQPLNVQPQQLSQNEETGKVTFPKHVFSQARYMNKKQQNQIVSQELPRVTCDICQKSLKTKKMLWAHKVAVHFGGNFPCELCGKKCITGAELRRHMTSHSTERKFVCQYCGLAYKRWSHLYQHLRVHEEEKNFRCDVCHLNFKVQSELKDHCFTEHTTGETVQCSVCKHNLQTPLAVYHHSMKHTGTRDFVCEICGSNFKRKQHLVTHMKTHLSEKNAGDGTDEVYECQACDEKFNLKMDMKSHCENMHPLPGDESATCKTCNKKLNVASSVYLHGLRHSGSREFQCEHCSQLFKRKAHLIRHKADRHPLHPKERKKRAVSTEPIVCTLCRKTFKYRTALTKHMIGQHGVSSTGDMDFSHDAELVYRKGIKKPHQCALCHKRFKSKGTLFKHKLNKHNVSSDDKVETGVLVVTEMQNIDIDMDKTPEEGEIHPSDDHTDIEKNVEEGAEEMDIHDKKPVELNVPNIPHQVITVDQQTGQLIIMEATDEQINAAKNEAQQVEIVGSSSSNDANQTSDSQLIVQSAADGTITTFSGTPSEIQTLEQGEQLTQLNQQVSMGQIVNQDAVALTSVSMQNVQGLTDAQNVLDFSQGANNEQIVVLLSALNSQNIQQI